ncbi:MAG TPA: hypothetical protein VFA33_24625 [Bryobacteraceae bacterium]|nr:hypothetical protein [Bryobacteraceae bacterium]
MTCREISWLLAGGGPLPEDAAQHLAACEACRKLTALGETVVPASLSAELEQRLVTAATQALRPVRPLGPPGRYMAALLGAAAAVAAAGIAVMGTAGWTANGTLTRAYFVTMLATGLAAAAATLSRMMFPGALPRLSPALVMAAALAAVLTGGADFPVRHYAHFGRAAAACFSIGLAHAALAGAAAALVLRRGLVLARGKAAALAGLLGGLAGLSVLFAFCPHLDLGHYLLGHASMTAAATALGWALAAGYERLLPRAHSG